MKNNSSNLSPEDKAIIEKVAASALCCAYCDTVHEPLPDKIVALLEELAARENESHRP